MLSPTRRMRLPLCRSQKRAASASSDWFNTCDSGIRRGGARSGSASDARRCRSPPQLGPPGTQLYPSAAPRTAQAFQAEAPSGPNRRRGNGEGACPCIKRRAAASALGAQAARRDGRSTSAAVCSFLAVRPPSSYTMINRTAATGSAVLALREGAGSARGD
eukprot:scaffold36192_cov60-Phaeocystis_antarctica.AAC.3